MGQWGRENKESARSIVSKHTPANDHDGSSQLATFWNPCPNPQMGSLYWNEWNQYQRAGLIQLGAQDRSCGDDKDTQKSVDDRRPGKEVEMRLLSRRNHLGAQEGNRVDWAIK